MRNDPSDFVNGVPKKKTDDMDKKAYRLGFASASLQVQKAQLGEQKMAFESDKSQLMQALLNMQVQQQQQQQMATYQGAQDATTQHLNDYSNSLAAMLGGGQQEQQGGMMPQQQPQQQMM